MIPVLVQWDNHSKIVRICKNQTAESLRDRCLFNLRREVRGQFRVYIKSSQGEEKLINDRDEFGNHLKECKFIYFKNESLKGKGLQAKMRMPVNHDFAAGEENCCSSLELYFDCENCAIPKKTSGAKIMDKLLEIFGPSFKDKNLFIVCERSQATEPIKEMKKSYENVRLILVDSKRTKDNKKKNNAADDMIKEKIFEKSDSRKPGTVVVVISGDKDFGSSLYMLSYKMGFVTVLIYKSLVDHDLLLWSTVSFTFDDLCRNENGSINLEEKGKRKNKISNKESSQKKIQEPSENQTLEDVDLTNENENTSLVCNVALDEQESDSTNVGGDALNFKKKCNITQENETTSRTLAEGFTGSPGERIKVRFCNKVKELLVYPWDTVGLLKQQIAYLLINEELKEFETDLIFCTTDHASAKITDETEVFELIGTDKEITFSFDSDSVHVVQTMTYLGNDSPLEDKPLLQSRKAEAVFIWDMTKKSCWVPDNKNGLHIAKRAIDRFCSDCKMKETIVFIDETEIKGAGESFSSVVRNVYINDIKSEMEEEMNKYDNDEKIVVITGNQEIAIYIEELKGNRTNSIILIPTSSIKNCLLNPEYTFEELICDLPDNPHTIKDVKKIVYIKTEKETNAFKSERKIKFSQNNAYTEDPFEKGTFQTTTAAKNFKYIIDGSELGGCKVRAYLAEEMELDKKGKDSSTEKNEDPPTTNANYKNNFNIPVKNDPSAVAQVKDIISSPYKPGGLSLPTHDGAKLAEKKLMGPDPMNTSKQMSFDGTKFCEREQNAVLVSKSGKPLSKTSRSQEIYPVNEEDDLQFNAQPGGSAAE